MTQHKDNAKEPVDTSEQVAPMHISHVHVENFRLLRDVAIDLDEQATVLVGRNNSGKTSLAEVFVRFLQPMSLKFEAADFSLESYADFRKAFKAFVNKQQDVARSRCPRISLTVTISYSAALEHFGPLSSAVVDLNPECTEAKVLFSYELMPGKMQEFFEGVDPEKVECDDIGTSYLMQAIRGKIPKLFKRTVTAIDPQDEQNTRKLEQSQITELIRIDFLKAQRGLDDEKEKPKDPISKLVQTLFGAAANTEAGTDHATRVEALSEAVSGIEQDLGVQLSDAVDSILPALKEFGYPGLNAPGILVETSLDIEKILASYTSIRHEGAEGVSLPESYSGLGSRNLILMLLTLFSYYRQYAARGNQPGVHLVFIEEPEAHLHPQMQEVFIAQLSKLADLLPRLAQQNQLWWPQFAVSTHSPHVANRAQFSMIRYFRVKLTHNSGFGSHSEILHLSKADGLDAEFLHKYMTVTRSDLFFAEKAILVEGMSERLIVPAVIRGEHAGKLDTLRSQYISVVEVGGAYAHLFFPLLDFLGIPSLIITDIDSVAPQGKRNRSRSPVHQGDSTSNATLKHWFASENELTPNNLIEAVNRQEIIRENRYLAYQVPEQPGGPCGRTFEDAFILANMARFSLNSSQSSKKLEEEAMKISKGVQKSDFAVRYAVVETDWKTPKYIHDGLSWLANDSQRHAEAQSEIPAEEG